MLSSQEQVGEVEARFSRGIPTIPNGWPAVSALVVHAVNDVDLEVVPLRRGFRS